MWPNLQFPADLTAFTEEILNGKLRFLWSANVVFFWLPLDYHISVNICHMKLVGSFFFCFQRALSNDHLFICIWIISKITWTPKYYEIIWLKFRQCVSHWALNTGVDILQALEHSMTGVQWGLEHSFRHTPGS